MRRMNGFSVVMLVLIAAAKALAQGEPPLEPIPMPLPAPRAVGADAANQTPSAAPARDAQPAAVPAARAQSQPTAQPATVSRPPAPSVMRRTTVLQPGSRPAASAPSVRVLPVPVPPSMLRRPAAASRSATAIYRRLQHVAAGPPMQVDKMATFETTNRLRPATFEVRVPTTYVPVRTNSGPAVIQIEQPAELRPIFVPGQPVRNARRARRR